MTGERCQTSVMIVTRTIVYRGNPPWHTALVQFLKEEGVRVEWSPPAVEEPRGLGVLPGQVGDAAGGREAFERGVSAVMVVDVQPGVKAPAAFGF